MTLTPLIIYYNMNESSQTKKANPKISFVPGVGIEPTLPKELDFESSASTNSATRANLELVGAKLGILLNYQVFRHKIWGKIMNWCISV